MSQKESIVSSDKLGMCTSILCMAHCLAIPILMFVGLESSIVFLDQEWIEHTLLLLTFGIGLWAFLSGLRKHKQHFIPVLFVAGFLLLLNGEGLDNKAMGLALTVFGAFVIVYAHLQNLKWRAHAAAS